MRLYSYIILFISFLIFEPSQLHAQVDDYAKEKSKRAERRAKNKGDQEVNKTIDKEIDKAFQKLKDAFKTNSTDDSEEDIQEEKSSTQDDNSDKKNDSSFDFSGFSSVDIDRKYHFVKSYRYDMEMVENGKTTDYTYNLEVPKSGNIDYMALETSQSGADGTIIFDHEIESMIVLTGNNSGTIMKFDAIQDVAAEQIEDNVSDFTFEPTGKSGNHLGYAYKEYAFKSEDGEGTVWISKDEEINLFKLFVEMGQKMQARKKNKMPSMAQFEQIDGLIIRSDMTSKEDDMTTVMELKEVTDIDKRLDTKDYQLMDLSAFMR